MGYITQLQFIGVEIRREGLEDFIQEVELIQKGEEYGWGWMLDGLRLYTSAGYLDWNLGKHGRREIIKSGNEPPLKPTDKNLKKIEDAFLEFWWDGRLFPEGKWYDTEALVHWLFPFCEAGQTLEISGEGDGEVWGWELDKKRGIRVLGLGPVSGWKKLAAKRGRTSKRKALDKR